MIATVLDSFAREAPGDAHLVFKHHPMDRGHRHYGRQIHETAVAAGVSERVHYVHDLHLPTLLRDARGVVLVNSTTGLSALFHGAPVKTLGRCLYDFAGLTHQGDLASFWGSPTRPDKDLYARFRNYLIGMTQVNGSFYSGQEVTLGNEQSTLRLAEAAPEVCDLPLTAVRDLVVRCRTCPWPCRVPTEVPLPTTFNCVAIP
jgi:capsular polysaccharide export protein